MKDTPRKRLLKLTEVYRIVRKPVIAGLLRIAAPIYEALVTRIHRYL